MARKPKSKVVKVAEAAAVMEAADVPLVAVPVRKLDPDVARAVSLYEAALAGDSAAFERIRDGRGE